MWYHYPTCAYPHKNDESLFVHSYIYVYVLINLFIVLNKSISMNLYNINNFCVVSARESDLIFIFSLIIMMNN